MEKSKLTNMLLLTAFIIPLVLLLWPFARWNNIMLLVLRVIPSFAIQMLLCRVGKNMILKVIPLVLTGILAIWGTYLFYTSQHWVNATFWGSLIADYVSPFICCLVAFIICIFAKKKK